MEEGRYGRCKTRDFWKNDFLVSRAYRELGYQVNLKIKRYIGGVQDGLEKSEECVGGDVSRTEQSVKLVCELYHVIP